MIPADHVDGTMTYVHMQSIVWWRLIAPSTVQVTRPWGRNVLHQVELLLHMVCSETTLLLIRSSLLPSSHDRMSGLTRITVMVVRFNELTAY